MLLDLIDYIGFLKISNGMIRLFVKLLTTCICLFFLSCTSIENQAVEGSWSIDEINYMHYDLKMCMLVNIIDFDKDIIVLPNFSNCDDIFVNDRQSTWRLIKSDSVPFLMEINSKNEAFNGVYKVIFEEDREFKLFRMILLSEDVFISMRKGLFDFDNEIERYKEIVDESQRGVK